MFLIVSVPEDLDEAILLLEALLEETRQDRASETVDLRIQQISDLLCECRQAQKLKQDLRELRLRILEFLLG